MFEDTYEQLYKIAVNTGIVSRPGAKPDFGNGVPRDQLTDWQRKTRAELTYGMVSGEATAQKIARFIRFGGTVTAWHSGGQNCKAPFELRDGQTVPHKCRARQHRCNANFILAQHLGADFDTLSSETELSDNALVRSYGSIIYHTPSSKPDRPKMRVIFLLDEPVTDGPLYRNLILAMQWKLEGKPDPACSDYCRLFYGNLGSQPTVTDKVLPLETAKDWLKEYETARPAKPAGLTQLITPNTNLSMSEQKRLKAFGGAVLNRSCDKVRSTYQGNRHYELKRQAFNVGTFVAGGVLSEYEARQALEEAYRSHISSPPDMDDLIEWAFSHAREYPQGLPIEDSIKRAEWYAARGYRYAV
jgi:hypothetical protein